MRMTLAKWDKDGNPSRHALDRERIVSKIPICPKCGKRCTVCAQAASMRSVVLAYHEVWLHIRHQWVCTLCGHRRHAHCYRCQKILWPGEKVGTFRNKGGTSHRGVPKIFCLDCGKLLSDSTVRMGA